MEYPLSIDNITSSLEFYSEVENLLEESRRYLKSHRWCDKINGGWLFTNLGKILCVFLYEIENVQSPEDNLIWIVVGDLPPMYLDTYNVSNTKEVIEVYIQLIKDWIECVETNQSLEECFPLESNHSLDNLQMLKRRIELLQNTILPEIINIPFNAAVK